MTITWSFQARIDYWSNIDYLEDEWSESEVRSFIENVDYNISLLKLNTVLFNATKYKNVFRVTVTKHITLFYSLNGDEIILLRFWSNFQNPDNFRLL